MADDTTQIAIGAVYAFFFGAAAGAFGYGWAVRLTPHHTPSGRSDSGNRLGIVAVLSGLLMAGLVVAELHFDCQATPNVLPAAFWRVGRVFYHGIMIGLLITATITDLREYVIPDEIVLPGMLIGVFGAAVSGDLQMMHVWIDWNQEIPRVRGAYIPEWIRQHHHLHGLIWSLAGAAVGAGLTWIVRWTSALILRRQALGLGDVTLMAMIGSFIGWQAVVCVFVLAPLCGIVLAVLTWIFTGRGFVPYGPYLAAATLIVLFSWRWLWDSLKWAFGDWQTLAIVTGISVTALVALLGVLRFYWSIPVKSTRRIEQTAEQSEPHGP